ncbi:MAG TPA: hypothetical protein PKZ32_22070 [Candidatus Melainabacteria bacterium]|nr:hypothetical protein [Candidatus Melainabacteria bacterium]
MFENYAIALSLLFFAWVVGNSLNRLFEWVSADKSPDSCLRKFGRDIDEKHRGEGSGGSLAVVSHTVLESERPLKF